MSQRAHITQTPLTHPSLFRHVSHSEVQAGDVYIGLKRSRRGVKWYANTEGQGCVDKHRMYYRPATPIPASQLGPFIGVKAEPATSPQSSEQRAGVHAPGAPCAGGPMEESEEGDTPETAGDSIPLFTLSVNKAGLRALIEMIDTLTDGKG